MGRRRGSVESRLMKNRREFVRRRGKGRRNCFMFDRHKRLRGNRVGPHSFFLQAEITGHIRCHCDACDGKFNLPVKSGFKLFLDEHATAFGDVSGDLEIVPFPRSTEHVDLTSVARSWIEMNLKEEFLCDECGENDGVVETWSLDYDGEVKITK